MGRRKITKVIIGTTVIGLAAGYLLYLAAKSSWTYYYSVDEFTANQSAGIQDSIGRTNPEIDFGRTIRLAGLVKEGSVVYNGEKMQLDFELAGKKNSVPVRYYGAVPKNFTAGREAVIEGKIGADGIFEAKLILTRCESKYRVRL